MDDRTTSAHMSDDELIGLLRRRGDALPRAVVEECISRGSRLIPHLSEIVSDPYYWYDAEEPESWAPVHATFILGAIGGTQVIPSLLRALDLSCGCDDEWVLEDLPSILGRFGREIQTPLRTRVQDWFQPPLLRACAAQGLAATTLTAPESTTEVFSMLTQALQEAGNTEYESFFEELLGLTLLDFCVPETKAPLLAYARKLETSNESGLMILPFTQKEVEEAFANREPVPAKYTKDWLSFYNEEETEERQRLLAKERVGVARKDERLEERDELEWLFDDPFMDMPAVRDRPKIGRNDPSPCGSRKKYKKCCLPKEETAHIRRLDRE